MVAVFDENSCGTTTNTFGQEAEEAAATMTTTASAPPPPAVFMEPPQHPNKRMIVFDKDGTLGDCRQVVRHWVHHMSRRAMTLLLEGLGNKDAAEQQLTRFYQQIGWNAATHQVEPSALVDSGTWEENVQVLYEFLLSSCSSSCCGTTTTPPIALETVQGWHNELRAAMVHDPPVVEDMRGMLQECKDLGYILAMCTSDDRVPTNAAMETWDIADLIEYSVCGNEVEQGKPSAVPLQMLCEQAGVLPQHCIVVGDTTADTGMARNAMAGFCVGVLTGSGTTEQLLEAGAQLVLPDAGHIPALLKSVQQATEDSSSSRKVLVQSELLPNSQKVGAS